MEQTKNNSESSHHPIPSSKRLGIIFDIDGTLISEHRNAEFSNRIILRPNTIPFLIWLKKRGHAIALWTKAHISHANNVKYFICKQVAAANCDSSCMDMADTATAKHRQYQHVCSEECQETFAFVWGRERLRKRSIPSYRYQTMLNSMNSSWGVECKWCEAYSTKCQQCTCYINYRCPCMDIKDLRSVWHPKRNKNRSKDDTGTGIDSSTGTASLFRKENTLIVENTPQNCIYNYGNAIYVPTFSGMGSNGDDVFDRLQRYIVDVLEKCVNVRKVQKCSHGKSYHACYEQSWLTDERYSNNSNTTCIEIP